MKKHLFLALMMIFINAKANVAAFDIERLMAEQSNQQTKLAKPIDALKDYYFIYVFKSNCPHCHNFTPVIKDFTDVYQVELRAYSIDGPTIDGIRSSQITPKLFDILFTGADYKPVVPALYLVNKETSQTYAVLFGETSAVGLASRLESLLGKIKENFDA